MLFFFSPFRLSFPSLHLKGDLGAIDEKYDVAISSSCGALDNIVVDTIDTAQRCVTFLKEQNVGVATFIGLDKVTNELTAERKARWRKTTQRGILCSAAT